MSCTSSTPPRCRCPALLDFCSLKRSRRRRRTSSTIAASDSWSATILSSNSPRAMSSLAPLPAKACARAGDPRPVYLDMRHMRNLDIHARFPGISAFLAPYSLDLARDPVPVRPQSPLFDGRNPHRSGRSHQSRRTLCSRRSRLHRSPRRQSPRLSATLLRGLGLRRARRAVDARRRSVPRARGSNDRRQVLMASEEAQVEELITQLQASMWTHAGLLRGRAHTARGAGRAGQLRRRSSANCKAGQVQPPPGGSAGHEPRRPCHSRFRNRAHWRTSGARFRSDYPKHDDQNFKRHSVFGSDNRVKFEEW